MKKKFNNIRPFHIWWVGIFLFAPSILVWGFSITLAILKGDFCPEYNKYMTLHIYFPLIAALVGLIVPVTCLWRLRDVSWRKSICVFAGYLVIFFTWGIIDIRNENYQMGGHAYPNDPLIDGHRYYFHDYFTWYFLPYRCIEQGIPDYPDDKAYLPTPADPNK
jgi:hypothetical protein